MIHRHIKQSLARLQRIHRLAWIAWPGDTAERAQRRYEVVYPTVRSVLRAHPTTWRIETVLDLEPAAQDMSEDMAHNENFDPETYYREIRKGVIA